MELNQYFPDKICINLDHRPERWERVSARFQRHAIRDVERFSAVDGRIVPNPSGWRAPPGAYACAQSHLSVVRRAKASGIRRLLIFEDDVEFDERFNERFADLIGGLPKRWDMLFFGSLLSREPAMVSRGIGRVQKAHSTFAYALNHTIFDAFIEINSNATQPVDNNNTLLQEQFHCYAFFPFLVWVESGYSDVEGAAVDHWAIRESLVLKSAAMERILARTCVIVTPRSHGQPGVDKAQLDFLVDSILTMDSEISMVILQPSSMEDEMLASLSSHPRTMVWKQTASSLETSAVLAARAQLESGKEFFYFTDSDLYLRRQDLKGCLQMARRHSLVRPFSELIQLSASDTGKLLDGKMRWIDDSCGTSSAVDDEAPGVWMATAAALEALSEWPPPAGHVRRKQAFQAPGRAARLSGGIEAE